VVLVTVYTYRTLLQVALNGKIKTTRDERR